MMLDPMKGIRAEEKKFHIWRKTFFVAFIGGLLGAAVGYYFMNKYQLDIGFVAWCGFGGGGLSFVVGIAILTFRLTKRVERIHEQNSRELLNSLG